MRFQKQLIKHDPDNGHIGDCFRTCIAILINEDAVNVPNFMDCLDTVLADKLALEYLEGKGFTRLSFQIRQAHLDCKVLDDWFGDNPYILTGKSPSFENTNHCVIAKGNCEIIYDPSESNKGLDGPVIQEGCPPYYWIEFIIKKMNYETI